MFPPYLRVYSFCSWEWKTYHIVVLFLKLICVICQLNEDNWRNCHERQYYHEGSLDQRKWKICLSLLADVEVCGCKYLLHPLVLRGVYIQIEPTYANMDQTYTSYTFIYRFTYIQVLSYDLFVASPSQDTSRIRKQRPRSSKAEFLECT